MENTNQIIEIESRTNNEINNILNEVKYYHSNKIYIITNEIESKIPLMLSYIQNYENEIINKMYIIKYINSLVQNIPYNLGIILSQFSDN